MKAENLQIFEITRTIYSNSERSEQCSWKFLRLDKLRQLKFKLEKKIGIEKHAGKVRKGCSKTGKGVLKQEKMF